MFSKFVVRNIAVQQAFSISLHIVRHIASIIRIISKFFSDLFLLWHKKGMSTCTTFSESSSDESLRTRVGAMGTVRSYSVLGRSRLSPKWSSAAGWTRHQRRELSTQRACKESGEGPWASGIHRDLSQECEFLISYLGFFFQSFSEEKKTVRNTVWIFN